jgi:hypothetical protein
MKIKKFNKTLSSLKWGYKQLENKEEKTPQEIDEYNEIGDFLYSLTIERKRKKKGMSGLPYDYLYKKGGYDYFIVDKTGIVVEKLKDYTNGTKFEYFWAFTHFKSTPEYEHSEQIIVDHGWGGEDSYIKDITVTTGGEDKEVQVLIDDSGDIIFDGIKEIHKYYFDFDNSDEDENGFLIVSIHTEFHKDLMSKYYNSFFYDHTKTTYCVINLYGQPLIKPTQNESIFFDSRKKIFFDDKGEELPKI